MGSNEIFSSIVFDSFVYFSTYYMYTLFNNDTYVCVYKQKKEAELREKTHL